MRNLPNHHFYFIGFGFWKKIKNKKKLINFSIYINDIYNHHLLITDPPEFSGGSPVASAWSFMYPIPKTVINLHVYCKVYDTSYEFAIMNNCIDGYFVELYSSKKWGPNLCPTPIFT